MPSTQDTKDPKSLIGKTVDKRYIVTAYVGGGGQKHVYAVETRWKRSLCALAVMSPTVTDANDWQDAKTHFEQEADLLRELNNEHIVEVLDRFSEGHEHYLVMEYVKGQTLAQRLKKAPSGKLSESVVVRFALQILDALEYLHGFKPDPVIYRDLKPDNIMVTDRGQIKLIDFGIARFVRATTNVTAIGTPGYAPREQYYGQAEPRSDLYALGATLHHLLTGESPRAGKPFEPLKELLPDINPKLSELIMKALEQDPDRRMSSATEFKNQLDQLIVATAPPVPGGSSAQSASRPSSGLAKPAQRAPSAKTGDFKCSRCGRNYPAGSQAWFCACGGSLQRSTAGIASTPAVNILVQGPSSQTTIVLERSDEIPKLCPRCKRTLPNDATDCLDCKRRRLALVVTALVSTVAIVFVVAVLIAHQHSKTDEVLPNPTTTSDLPIAAETESVPSPAASFQNCDGTPVSAEIPSDVLGLRESAIIAEKEGHHDEALAGYTAAANRLDPVSEQKLGDLASDDGERAQYYQHAFAHGDLDAAVSLGTVFEKSGDPTNARNCFERASVLYRDEVYGNNPNGEAAEKLGYLYLEHLNGPGRDDPEVWFQKAREILQHNAQSNPTTVTSTSLPEFESRVAQKYQDRGNYKSSASWYEHSATDGGGVDAAKSAAEQFFNAQDYESAKKWYLSVAQQDQDDLSVLVSLARVYAKMDLCQKAVDTLTDTFNQAIKTDQREDAKAAAVALVTLYRGASQVHDCAEAKKYEEVAHKLGADLYGFCSDPDVGQSCSQLDLRSAR